MEELVGALEHDLAAQRPEVAEPSPGSCHPWVLVDRFFGAVRRAALDQFDHAVDVLERHRQLRRRRQGDVGTNDPFCLHALHLSADRRVDANAHRPIISERTRPSPITREGLHDGDVWS